MSLPSLLVTPGPTEIPVAPGRVAEVAEVHKKRPEAVFCSTIRRQQSVDRKNGEAELTVSGLKR